MKITVHGDQLSSSLEHAISGGDKSSWYIPEEVPVAFVYNRRNYAVMMATPDDLADLAIGFTLTENLIKSPDDIISLDIYQTAQGIDLRFKLSDEAIKKLDITQRRRNLIGSASCGLCGLENADVLFTKLTPVSRAPISIESRILGAALNSLREHQELGRMTRTVHAAAWSDMQGRIIYAREDVGRHNALDKLLGAMSIEKTDIDEGFVVMSSRCSYEIVEKAARCGVKALISVSAPTAFALRKAEEAHMALYANSQAGPVRLV